MENSSDRFFKGFSLEDYRLQVLVNRLEKEKKQCLNRLKEETHVFKMSVRQPVKYGEEYWSQYGEYYHANGEKKEKGSVTHLSREHKEDLNNSNSCTITAHHHGTNNSKHRAIVIAQDSLEHGLTQNVQRSSLHRIRSRSNRKQESKKKPKPPGLTLLEILCADVEHGVLLLKKTGKQSESCRRNRSSNLGHEPDKHSKKAHKKGKREKRLHSDSDKSLKFKGNKESTTGSPSSKDGRLEDGEFEAGDASTNSRSNSTSFEVLNSDNSLKTSSISTWGVSSQENVPLQDRSTQNLNWTSRDSTNNFGLGDIGKRLQSSTEGLSHEGNSSEENHRKTGSAALGKHSIFSDNATKNERSTTSNRAYSKNRLEAQTSENQSRFVHFKEGCKLTRKKGRKQSSGFGKNNEKEKFNRTKSSEVKLFQVDVPQTSQRRRSQEEIDKETRQKMDQFFAKVERTKNLETSRPRWRCSSGGDRGARVLRERKNFLESGKRPHIMKKEGYRRAQPWPTQVWS